MATLNQFMDFTRGRLPGCPEQLMEKAVLEVCIEFCKRTQLLVEAIDIPMVVGTSQYAVVPTSDLPWDMIQLRREALALTPLARLDFLTARLDVLEGSPQYYYLEDSGMLVVGPIPEAEETLSALVTLRPDDDATTVPDVLFREFRNPIAAGARAWVRRHHGDWSESLMEAEDRNLFERAVNNQNSRRARGGVDRPLRVQSHSF